MNLRIAHTGAGAINQIQVFEIETVLKGRPLRPIRASFRDSERLLRVAKRVKGARVRNLIVVVGVNLKQPSIRSRAVAYGIRRQWVKAVAFGIRDRDRDSKTRPRESCLLERANRLRESQFH